jgi:hypothetical protein
VATEYARKRSGEQGLANSGHVFYEDMTPTEQGDKQQVERVLVANDHARDRSTNPSYRGDAVIEPGTERARRRAI